MQYINLNIPLFFLISRIGETRGWTKDTYKAQIIRS